MAKSIVVRSGATVYPGRDNPTVIAFYDGASLDTTTVAAVTRLTVDVGGVTVDSSLYASLFDWTTGAAIAEVTLRLGSLALPCPATGATVTAFTATDPLGVAYPNVGISVALPPLPSPVSGTQDSITMRDTGDGSLHVFSVDQDLCSSPYWTAQGMASATQSADAATDNASLIKGVWHVSTASTLTNHGSTTTVGAGEVPQRPYLLDFGRSLW